MLTGSLGMLPSASLGAPDADRPAQGAVRADARLARPTSPARAWPIRSPTLLSFAMMLRYSFDLGEEADLVERAVENVLNGGLRTADIMQPGMARVSTLASWVTRSSANWRRWRRKHHCRSRQKSPPDGIRRAFFTLSLLLH